jgi:hypothetical protein
MGADGFISKERLALNRSTILMPDANWLNLGKIGMAKTDEVDGLVKA